MKKKILILLIAISLTAPAFAIEKYTPEYTKLFNTVLNEEKQPEITNEYRDELIKLYYYQRSRNEWANAAKTIDKVVDISEQLYGKDDIETAREKLVRADNNFFLGFLPEAYKELQEVYNISKIKGYDELENGSIFAMANVYNEIGEHAKAIEYYNKIKNKTGYEGWSVSDIYMGKSNAYMNLSDTKKAIKLINDYYNSLKNPTDFEKHRYYQNIANIYSQQGKYAEAIDCISKAEKFVKTADDDNKRFDIGIAFFKSSIYRSLDRNDEAAKIYKEIQNYLDKGINNGESENLYMNYMNLYSAIGDNKNYNKYYKKLQNHYKDYPQNSLRAISFKEREINYLRSTGKVDEAIALTDDVLLRTENLKDFAPIIYSRYLCLASENYMAKNDIEKAKSIFDKAFKYFKKAAPINDYGYTGFYTGYAGISKDQNDLTGSINYYNKALEYAKKAERYIDILNINKSIAYLYIDMNNKEKAKEYIDKAVDISKQCYGLSSSKHYDNLIEQYYLYKQLQLNEEADILLNEINNNIGLYGIVGNKERIMLKVNIENANKSLSEGDTEKALEYAKIAKDNVKSDDDRNSVNNLYYNIYNQSGKKIKSITYKKRAHIE